MKNVTHKKATFLRQLALTLLVALLAAAQTASAEDSPGTTSTYYIDADGTSHDVEAVVLTGSENELNSGRYVINNVEVFVDSDWEGEGTEQSPYLIKTTDDLDRLAQNVNVGNNYSEQFFKLGADINYANVPQDESGSNYTAIGNDDNPFKGTFNGNGHTISGIRINKGGDSDDDRYQGLFGYLGYGANVHDVKLSNSIITGCYYTGGIAGFNDCGTISGCTIDKVEIGVANSYASCHGGIVGFNHYSTLRGNLAIDVNIYALSEDDSYGVIAGENDKGTLENNYYYNCSVDRNKVNSNIGVRKRDLSDADNNYGAAPAHAITVPDGVTLSDNCIKYSGKYYTVAGVDVEVTVTGYENFSVTVESAVVTETNGKYVFTMPAADVSISVVTFEEGALKIGKGASGTIAILDGAYTGGDGFTLTKDIEVDEVTFSRAFTNGTTSTIILPFDIPAGKYSGGKFYELTSFDTDKGECVANATIVSDVKAHTPYIFVPDGSTFTITGPVTLKAIEGGSASVTEGNWTFTGVYQRKRWGAYDGNNKDYCFAANKTDDINIGDFVKIGTYVQIKPFRCYLTYNDGTSKAATILPENIKVRIVDATASVIDNPADPVVEHNDDFETPVSEIVPSANVKVWSYDKTIYISAAAGSNYRIIDVNGRALATGVTATDRDEIRLGNRSGIVIVIINGKTFKLKY